MFRVLSQFFRFIFAAKRAATIVSTLDLKILECRKIAAEIQSTIEAREAVLQRQYKEVESELKYTQQALDEAKVNARRLDELNDTLREQLRTANEVTIPGLILAHETMMSRWRAEMTVNVMKAKVLTLGKENTE